MEPTLRSYLQETCTTGPNRYRVAALLEKKTDTPDSWGETSLFYTGARAGMVVKQVLLYDDARRTNRHGWTAFHNAMYRGSLAAATALKQGGADVFATTTEPHGDVPTGAGAIEILNVSAAPGGAMYAKGLLHHYADLLALV